MNARHLLAPVILLGVLALSVSARATAPQGLPCASDSDCDGCQRCSADGHCPFDATDSVQCLCDAECQLIGLGACEVSAAKPLCGGSCIVGNSTALVCSAGADLATLEVSTSAFSDSPARASKLDETDVILVRFQ